MDEILSYLAKNLSFLYKKFGFRIVDSLHSDSFGGEGYIILRSNEMELRLVNDRSQLFLDFRSTEFDKENCWHSTDVVMHLLTGNVCESSVLDDKLTRLLLENFGEIVGLFSSSNAKKTVKQLKKLQTERAKRSYG